MRDRQVDGFCAVGMVICVFTQIDQNLFDEDGIHGNHEKFLRNRHIDLTVGMSASKFLNTLGHYLFQRLLSGDDIHILIADMGDRQEIFHHMQQPAGILVNISHQFILFVGGEIIGVLQIGQTVADDAGERSAQIVRDCPQQVGAKPFLLCLCQLFLICGKLHGLSTDPFGLEP